MKITVTSLLWLVVSVLALQAAHGANTAAVDEVLKLKSSSLGDETIVAFIQSRNINYSLTADDTIALKSQGVSAAVLNAMLLSGKGATAATPASNPVATSTVTVAPPPTSVLPPASVAPQTSEVAYFHQQLSPYGHWLLADDGHWYWQPTVAVGHPDWRPYWDHGRWVYTDHGWYWSSDYPWGWAAFHYGRWRLHPAHGWIWLPDSVWGPAWVVWRSGGEYCGWAPMPPGAHLDTVSGRLTFHGNQVAVGFGFGLDWFHFNFCLVKELGASHPTRLRHEPEIRAAYRHSSVAEHYTVSHAVVNSQVQVRVVNHGIEPSHVAAARGRAVETIRVEDLRSPPPGPTHERLDRQNHTLEVYRPKLPESGKH